jgi:hypothetical protein
VTAAPTDRQAHWQKVYRNKTADSVTWYRPHLGRAAGGAMDDLIGHSIT